MTPLYHFLVLEQRSGACHVALVDFADRPLVESRRWSYKAPNARGRTGYVGSTIRTSVKTSTTLHRVLLGNPSEQVDHINGDGLDNRRCNLRLASRSDNKANAATYKNNRHGFKGATPYKGRWRAQIVRGGTHHALGIFDTAEEAHAAYCRAAERLHGAFAHAGGSK